MVDCGSKMKEDEEYLELCESPIRFDPASKATNVFFDDTNGQVFAVRSSGVTGVIVKGPDEKSCTTFRMEDRGRVISIKFNPDKSVLAVQRSQSSVDFINFIDLNPTTAEYSQSCRWKNGSVLGLVWTKSDEIAFVSDRGIELLQVFPEKRQLKSIKHISVSASWFSWCAKNKLVLLANENGSYLHPFILTNSTISKLPKLEIEGSRPISERDVSCAQLYNSPWCLILRHGSECPAEVLAMPLDTSSQFSQTHIFRTELIGRFAINVVDDLVIVHHQASQTSMLFDIMDEGIVDGNIIIHNPIAPAKSLKPVVLPDQPCQMYSTNWVVFQPDIVIDARLGCLWHINLNTNGLRTAKPEKIVGVLLRRTNGKGPIFDILRKLIDNASKNLPELMKIFDQINFVYRKWRDMESAKVTGQNAQNTDFVKLQPQKFSHKVLITQQDMYTNVFQHYVESADIIQVLLNYLYSLAKNDLSTQHALTEMLVCALVKANRFSDLHQLLQYGAIGDSKPLACLLLSLANLHPAAHQLAMDMLHKLKAYEDAVEVLLGGGEVIAGIGAAKQYSKIQAQMQNNSQIPQQLNTPSVWNSLPARKLLSAAQNDVNTFISVYHALIQRNKQSKNSALFFKGEQCDSFVKMYESLFS